MFDPLLPPERMASEWGSTEAKQRWEREVAGERIVGLARRTRLDPETLVLYPDLIFRRYRDDELLEEIVQPIVMRCWYAEQVIELLHSHGFRIEEKWGGFAGEAWGQGNELVIRFGLGKAVGTR